MLQFIFALLMGSAFAGTSFTCETKYDQMGIPHVTTSSMDEFYYCFGLHHGKDRAWEMDYFRRTAEGRNAEILGFSQMKSDLMMRLLDLPALAERIWNEFPLDKRRMVEQYTAGVNEGFKTGKNSFEFKDKGYSPEPWKPRDSILVLVLQSFDQTRKTFFKDYEEEKAKEKYGEKAAALFDEDNLPWENTILKEGEYQKATPPLLKTTSTTRPYPKMWGHFPEVFGRESGSNNWVVSSKKSKNGFAMLANDPHLDLKTPMFWYWINIKAPEGSVMGGTLPGVPLIPAGTNGKVAWGLTNSYYNSADAVFVKDLKAEDLETIRPTVKIKFWFLQLPFFFKSFEKLKIGNPVLPLETEKDGKLLLRWTGYHLKPEDIYSMFDLFKVQNVTEMNELTKKIGVPSWNFVFADSKGDIGYRLIGRIYKTLSKSPFGIPELSLGDFRNEQFLSPEERPAVLKPARGYVYTANNRHWPSDAKFYGGRGYSHSFRGFRIDEMLKNKVDLEEMRNIQCDDQVVDARFYYPLMAKHLDLPELKDWNLRAEDLSQALPVYRRLFDLMIERWEVNEYALYRILSSPDPKQIEEMKELLVLARKETANRTWGDIHKVNFPHMSKNGSWVFSPELPGVGDTHTVNPGTGKWNEDRKLYEQNSGASMRMLIVLQDKPEIWLALPGVNREYDKKPDPGLWMNWKKCQYSRIEF